MNRILAAIAGTLILAICILMAEAVLLAIGNGAW